MVPNDLRGSEVTGLDDCQERLMRLLALTSDGWWEADLVRQTVHYSTRWRELLGYEEVELTDPWEVWNTVIHPDDLAGVDTAIAAAVAEHAPAFTVRARCIHRTGHEVPTLLRGLIDYEAGQPVRFSGTTTDLTEASRAELAKEQLIAVLSHELRTPLTAIAGALETLLARLPAERTDHERQLLELAARNAGRLGALIDDLLDLEAVSAGMLALEVSEQPVAAVLEQAVANQLAAAHDRGVEVVLEHGAAERTVVMDRRRIVQVVGNLVSNAIKHAPERSTVTVSSTDADADRVRIVVVDHGSGVPADFADRIFTPFSQADSSDRRPTGGSGLGLALSKALMEQHGGTIGYAAGDGATRFWIELPGTCPPVADRGVPSAPSPAQPLS